MHTKRDGLRYTEEQLGARSSGAGLQIAEEALPAKEGALCVPAFSGRVEALWAHAVRLVASCGMTLWRTL